MESICLKASFDVVVYYAISCQSRGVMRPLILLAALLCVACSSALPSFKPYKMDIQQGNVVTSKMMLQLRPGMTKSQVRFIMGSPLLQDSFHRDRWDYFYQMRKGGKVIEQRRVIMEFENDALKRVRGDVIPASPEDVAVAPAAPAAAILVEPKAPENKDWLDRLKFWKKDDANKPSGAEYYDMKPATPVVQEDPAAPRKVVPELAVPGVAPVVAPASSATQPAAQQPASPPSTAKPAAKPAAGAAASSQAAPHASQHEEEDLPPEDEPGYFERMLEKIGF